MEFVRNSNSPNKTCDLNVIQPWVLISYIEELAPSLNDFVNVPLQTDDLTLVRNRSCRIPIEKDNTKDRSFFLLKKKSEYNTK